MADDKELNAPKSTPGGFAMPELKRAGGDDAAPPPKAEEKAPDENADDADDTRTRRTVKLGSIRPVSPAEDFPEIAKPSATPLTGSSPDDTRTRRTVRLSALQGAGQRPMPASGPVTEAPPSLNPVPPVPSVSTDSGVIADPLGARSTDTGGIGVMDDTKTRKTMVIKPLKPNDAQPLPPEALPPAGSVDPLKTRPDVPNAMADTRTRKTLKLSAIQPNAPRVTPGELEAPLRASEVDDTVKLQRPAAHKMMPGGIGAPTMPGVGVTLPKAAPARAVDPSRQTVKLEQMAEEENTDTGASDSGEDTQTRPVAPLNLSKATIRLKPSDLPSGPQPLPSEASMEAPVPAAAEAQEAPKAAAPKVNLIPPKPSAQQRQMPPKPGKAAPEAAAEAKAPEAPEAAAAVETPEAAAPAANPKRGAKRVAPELKKKPETATEAAPMFQPMAAPAASAQEVSKFYTFVAVAVLLLTLFCTALTVIQYINVWEPTWTDNQKIGIPMVDDWVVHNR